MVLKLGLGSVARLQANKMHFKPITCGLIRSNNYFRKFLRIDSNNYVNPSLSYFKPCLLSCNSNYIEIICNMSHDSNDRRKILKQQAIIKDAFHKKQEDLRKTEELLKIRGKVLLNDFKEKKTRMKAKVEEFIERENIWTIPNFLCVFRISISPWLGYLILDQSYNFALSVLVAAAISDLLDGWVARNFKNQSSKLGSFLDPVADKILVATMFLTLTFVDVMPLYLTSLIILRDFTLVCAGFYIRYKSLPPPRTFKKYFDLTLATAQLAPTLISKINTTVQLITVGTSLAAPIFNFTDHIALQSLWCVTAVTTVASAVSYMYARNTYRLLNVKKNEKSFNQKL